MDADLSIIHRMRNGDEAAIEAFVRKNYPTILRYCYYHTSDNRQAEDLTQETFYRFFKSFTEYSHKGKLTNYLYVIAGNLCRDYWRTEERNKHVEMTEDISCKDMDLEIERKVDVQNGILSLPEEIREIILLHYFMGMKLREIAEVEGISLPLVKYRLMRGKALLRNILGKEE